jgi:hypothetical protein
MEAKTRYSGVDLIQTNVWDENIYIFKAGQLRKTV